MVFARATRGSEEDMEFRHNFKNMCEIGFDQLGAYHYFLGGKDAPTPEKQFQILTNILDEVRFNRRENLVAIAVQTGKFLSRCC